MSPDNANGRDDVLGRDALWTTKDLAQFLHVPDATIYRWRYFGGGPVAHRVGRHLRFRRQDVERWLEGTRDERRGE